MLSKEQLKTVACNEIDKYKKELSDLSRKIWEKPELQFEEHVAHDALTAFLEDHGCKVEKKFILPTGFRTEYGEGPGATVAILCEYDALPEIGHACGHNLIAEAGIGAGIGVKAALEAAMKMKQNIGKLQIIGTPAEEGGGGKVLMINAGVFKNIDVAMMCHPSLITAADPTTLCIQTVKVKYLGKASHASASPWTGINALDAAVMAYASISSLRQQLKPTWRVHGVITNGGAKPNIIPEETSLEYYIRTPTTKEMKILRSKITDCFEGAALSTSCKVEFEWSSTPYENIVNNKILVELYKQNASPFDLEFCTDRKFIDEFAGSTDMGNVSHITPSIHPMYKIGNNVVNHTREFTAASGDAEAQPWTVLQAKLMAMTAIDVLCGPDMLKDIKKAFKEDIEREM